MPDPGKTMEILAEHDNVGFPVHFVRTLIGVEYEYCLMQYVGDNDHPHQKIYLTKEAARKLGLLKDADGL